MPLIVRQVFVGGFDQNFSYIIYDDEAKEGIIIDPAGDIDLVTDIVDKECIKIKHIVNTHSHFDHTEKNSVIKKLYGASIITNENESMQSDIKVPDNYKLSVGYQRVLLIHTPGHTHGSMCILAGKKLITGDTLFVGGCGRCDLSGGNSKDMYKTLEKIKSMDDDIEILPGHDYGRTPTSTIGREKKENRFLLCKDEQEFLKERMT